jgi:hypothetical protein
MAHRKRKCVRFGKSHGRKVCRKFSGAKKSSSRSHRRGGAGLPGLTKAIRATSRRSCANPARAARMQALFNYIRASASVTMNQGVPALGKTAAMRNLKGLQKSLKSTARLGTKCVMQAERKAKARARRLQKQVQRTGTEW